MATPKQHPEAIGRIAPSWRIGIFRADGSWEARLLNQSEGYLQTLGTFASLSEAKEQGIVLAKEVLKSKNVETHSDILWAEPISAQKQRVAANEKVRSVERFRSYISVAMGVVAATTAALLGLVSSERFIAKDTNTTTQLQEIDNRLAATEAKLNSLSADLGKVVPESKLTQLTESLREDITRLKERLDNYEAAIGDEPAKRLALPILRRDMDTLKEEHRTDLAALHDEINRTIELMKWLLILFGAGSFFSGIIGNWPPWGRKKEI